MKINENTTIHDLRRAGAKIRVVHYRRLRGDTENWHPVSSLKNKTNLSSKGGITEMQVTLPDGRDYSITAKCADVDSFNRKIGIKICLGRLSKVLNEGTELDQVILKTPETKLIQNV
jgi:hypothetical protein